MTRTGAVHTILVAEDNAADRGLYRRIAAEEGGGFDLRLVEDGEEALDYLEGRGKYSDPASRPCPNLLLLDINMPRRDGWAVLEKVKTTPRLKTIPTVMLSGSDRPEDINRGYQLGCSSYVKKPSELNEFRKTLHCLTTYWLTCVRLPDDAY
ncbi:MAG: response regulator [Acidobacteria bacterium]|nr:response regulator [Acidobacteriota bacterium]